MCSFTFKKQNVEFTTMLLNSDCGLFSSSARSLSKSLCPYPFVLAPAAATNWLGTINLQISSFVLTLSPSACPFKQLLFDHKTLIVQSLMSSSAVRKSKVKVLASFLNCEILKEKKPYLHFAVNYYTAVTWLRVGRHALLVPTAFQEADFFYMGREETGREGEMTHFR